MNDHEIADLARLLPVPDGRDLPAGRQQTLEEHLMTELRQQDPATTRPRTTRPRTRRARGLLAVGAGLAAGAVAVAALVATHPQPRTQPGPQPGTKANTTPATAAALLAKIASAAASQPSPAVRDSEFMYIRSEVAYTDYSVLDGKETSTMEKLHERQIWLPVADLCVTGLLVEHGERTPLSPFPIVNGKIDRTPPPGQPRPNVTCPSEGHLGDATYRLLQSLPTEPAALLDYLEAGKKWTNDDPVNEIGDLIREAIIPPAVAAALYRLAATLPGATLLPDAVNATGRHGIGIVWAQRQYRTEWIFDQTTLQYIGERDYDTRTGQVSGESAIIAQAFTERAGQLP